MIVEPITIVVNNSYNTEEWHKQLIVKCLTDNPFSNVDEIALLLGLSDRTLYRYFKEHNVDYQKIQELSRAELIKLSKFKKSRNKKEC